MGSRSAGGCVTNVLVWLREVDDRARSDASSSRPPAQAITLVAHYRVLHADPDGSNCFPAQSTLARLAGVDRTTVRAVDAWLVDSGLMKHVRNRARGQREYLLEADADSGDDHTLAGSDDGPSHHLSGNDDDSDGGLDDYLNENRISDGGSDEAQMVAPTTTTLGPTTCVKGFTDYPTGRPVDNRAPPDDAQIWQEAHPNVPLAETA